MAWLLFQKFNKFATTLIRRVQTLKTGPSCLCKFFAGFQLDIEAIRSVGENLYDISPMIGDSRKQASH